MNILKKTFVIMLDISDLTDYIWLIFWLIVSLKCRLFKDIEITAEVWCNYYSTKVEQSHFLYSIHSLALIHRQCLESVIICLFHKLGRVAYSCHEKGWLHLYIIQNFSWIDSDIMDSKRMQQKTQPTICSYGAELSMIWMTFHRYTVIKHDYIDMSVSNSLL